MTYNYQDIKNAYNKLGVKKGRTVLIKTDIRFLGPYKASNQADILKSNFDALSELIDLSKGTLVVCTASTSLCNTNIPFDLKKTKSERGVLTEYIRNQPGAIRSLHPFMSYTAIGKDANFICRNVSRHAFGPESPKSRIIDMDGLFISIGLHPRLTCSVPHHVEIIMGVPYRYTKEFMHPIVWDGEIRKMPFYLYVWYKECQIKKDQNIKIFKRFIDSGYTCNKQVLGRGNIYSLSLKDYFVNTLQAFKDDIFVCLEEEPEIKPYRA